MNRNNQASLAQQQARVGQAIRRQAQVGQAQDPVSVGACGVPPWGGGFAGGSPTPYIQEGTGYPYFNPAPPPCPPVFDIATAMRLTCVPLGVQFALLPGNAPTTATFVPYAGIFQCYGISSCMPCDVALLLQITPGGSTCGLLAGPVDPGVYNTNECMCCIPAFCTSTSEPGRITAQALGDPTEPPVMNICFFGCWSQGYGCYPGLFEAIQYALQMGVVPPGPAMPPMVTPGAVAPVQAAFAAGPAR